MNSLRPSARRVRRWIMISAMSALLPSAPLLAQQMNGDDMAKLMRELGGSGLTGEQLDRAVADARQFPFGTKENPVRTDGPRGEQLYLRRLRCADGTQPSQNREGSTGTGPYGYILDLYNVKCGSAVTKIYMDMYHGRHVETLAVPGFTIVDP